MGLLRTRCTFYRAIWWRARPLPKRYTDLKAILRSLGFNKLQMKVFWGRNKDAHSTMQTFCSEGQAWETLIGLLESWHSLGTRRVLWWTRHEHALKSLGLSCWPVGISFISSFCNVHCALSRLFTRPFGHAFIRQMLFTWNTQTQTGIGMRCISLCFWLKAWELGYCCLPTWCLSVFLSHLKSLSSSKQCLLLGTWIFSTKIKAWKR